MKKNISCKNPRFHCLRIDSITCIIIALLISIFPFSTVRGATPTPSLLDVSGYEIPLGELNKVKKERAGGQRSKDHKRTKSKNTTQPPPTVITQPDKAIPVPSSIPNPSSGEAVHDNGQQTTSGALNSIVAGKPEEQQSGQITIHHDPYSYVINGKRTMIQGVISSAENIQAVYCRFRATENGAYALVPMLLTPGSQFTYAAALPSLAAASRSLRYSIVVIDSLGKEARSPEFVIAVKPSGVMPGWQFKSSADMIKIRFENKEKPLEGFSDPGIIVE